MFSIRFAKRLMQHPDIMEHRRYKDSNDNLTDTKKYLKQKGGSSFTVSSSDEEDSGDNDDDDNTGGLL